MEHDDQMASCAIEIICPRCGASELDDYEVLDAGCVHTVRCSSCGRRFHLTILDCEACGAETVVTWVDAPTPQQIQRAQCATCGARPNDHEAKDTIFPLGPR